jgi:hypothetical protein
VLVVFLFLFHPPSSLSHQLAAPSRDSVLAVPILISKQIPLELLALASRRKKTGFLVENDLKRKLRCQITIEMKMEKKKVKKKKKEVDVDSAHPAQKKAGGPSSFKSH